MIDGYIIPIATAFGGFALGSIPVALLLGGINSKVGSLNNKVDSHIADDKEEFGNLKEHIRSEDNKLDDLVKLMTEVQNDVKWIKRKNGFNGSG